jgi:hypothetical protein
MKSRLFALGLIVIVVLNASPALSQGCAMCLNNAAAAPAESQRALKRGIFVLLVPSVGAMFGLIGLAYRNRNHFYADEQDEIPD